MMIISVAMYFLMPDSPGSCTFLTEEVRCIGVLRIQLEQLSAGKKEAITREHFKTAMLNINTWLMGLGLFGSLLSMNSIALFMVSSCILSCNTFTDTAISRHYYQDLDGTLL